MGSMFLRNPPALSSALDRCAWVATALNTRGFLNCVDPSDLASNYYTENQFTCGKKEVYINHTQRHQYLSTKASGD